MLRRRAKGGGFGRRSAKLNSFGCCDYSRSLSDASGLDSWFSLSSFGSFFLPVAIPLRSCFHVLRDTDGSPGGCHPPFASPLNLSMISACYSVQQYASKDAMGVSGATNDKVLYLRAPERAKEAQPWMTYIWRPPWRTKDYTTFHEHVL
jgi:hypothetical protein